MASGLPAATETSSNAFFVSYYGRLTCIGLTLLAAVCSGYESMLVDAPRVLDGSWTVACVVAVFVIFGLPLWAVKRSEWRDSGGFTTSQCAGAAFHAALELTAMWFVYRAIELTPVGDAVALYNLR